MKNRFIVFQLLFLSASYAFSQNISGEVYDANNHTTLQGAFVFWVGTNSGTLTDDKGKFEISSDSISDKRLIVSYVGLKSDTILITSQTTITVYLHGEKSIKEVEVEADKPTAYISLNPIKTEVITQKELTKSACCDLAGCFETQASVQPQTTNVITNSKELRILGLSGVYNQLLFDGMPLFQGLSFTYGISSIPGLLIDNIFVSKGANSVLQGYESISGQINIVPKSADKADKLLLNVYMNNFMEKHFNAVFSTNVGKNKKWQSLFALHSILPAKKTDRDKDKFIDLPLLTRYMAYNNWKYGSENENGFFTSIGVRYLIEQRVGGQDFFNPSTDKGSSTNYGQVVDYNQPELYTKTGYRFNDDHAIVWMASSFYQQQSSYFGTLRYDAKQLNGYANLQHEWIWKEQHMLKYGFSYRYQKLNETISFTNNNIKRTYAGNYNTNQDVPGFFAENTFHWKEDKIVWIVGTRIDHHNKFGAIVTPRSLLKYELNKNNTIRGSVGSGWRQVNLFSENINLLTSSRDIVFAEDLNPEKAINWGLNYTSKYYGNKVSSTFSVDYYHTNFMNQIFPDYDSESTKAIIRNFTGASFSNGFQLESTIKAFEVFEFKVAYNYLDVYRMINEKKIVLPFNPKNRIMSALSYRPLNEKWYFDLNAHWYDKQRLPNTSGNPTEFQYPDYSKPFYLLNVQITHLFKRFEVYLGCENLFDFRQLRPIISWQDPFSKYFDTSSVWGPTRGREIYAGFRWRLK